MTDTLLTINNKNRVKFSTLEIGEMFVTTGRLARKIGVVEYTIIQPYDGGRIYSIFDDSNVTKVKKVEFLVTVE